MASADIPTATGGGGDPWSRMFGNKINLSIWIRIIFCSQYIENQISRIPSFFQWQNYYTVRKITEIMKYMYLPIITEELISWINTVPILLTNIPDQKITVKIRICRSGLV
jgi:hypothetical protein